VAFGLIAIATGAKANSGGDLIRSSSSPRDTRSHPRDRATGITAVLAWVCVLAGVAVAVTTISAFDASRAAWRSQEWRLAGKLNEAIAAALVATSRDPGRAEYWQRLGLAYVAATRWGEAANALERAVALAPWDVRMSSDLVQTQLILANSGDIAARLRAIQLADDAVGRDRNYPPAHYMRAVVMQFTGNVPEGLRSIERALALSPRTTNARWYVVATQLLVAAGRATDGVGVAEGGLRIVESHLIRIELARALLASGRPQEALAQVESVLAVEPGNAPAQLLRDQILATIPK
jgi:tetratricopeptide (TPR) repeat protein